MKHKVFYYNFVWKDFSNTSMTSLLDMVKVVSFALQEGKVKIFRAKIATNKFLGCGALPRWAW